MARNYRLYCSVYGCMNSSLSEPGLTFFKLPTDSARLTQWLELMCREDLAQRPNKASFRVCEKHFVEQNILPSAHRKVLKRNALPSLNLPDFQSTVQEDSPNESHAHATTSLPCKKKYENVSSLNVFTHSAKKLKLHETENKTNKAEESSAFNKLCDTFLTKELVLLVNAQTNLKLHGEENRYGEDYINYCFGLYLTSPQAYRFLQSTLCLPCTTTLYEHCFPFTTEINKRAMSILKIKVERMTEAEKNCSVMIGSMTLKAHLFYDIKEDKIIGFHEVDGWQSPKPANNVLVIIVRGIFANWKHPIAYALLSECKNYENINKWVDSVLEQLHEIGLNIRTFVSNQRSDLWKAAKRRFVSIVRPYFFINGRKIYYIFDAPHLIKNVRNNMMQYNFQFGKSVAKYEHIVQFYNHDEKKSCRLAPKLTNHHVTPKNFNKMKVSRYASQLFSKSVAAGISTLVDYNDIEESGRDTAKFVTIMNDLFDSLNSSNLRHYYEYKRAFAGTESQKAFFKEMLSFFQDLTLVNLKNGRNFTNVRFIEGFQITITSLMLLFDELRLEGYTCLYTRRLNQDALENLFDRIRTKKGVTVNPTSRKFASAFKTIYFSIKPSKGGNSADGLGQPLVQTTDEKGVNTIPATINETSKTDNEESDSSVQITSSDYNQLDMSEINSLFYICGFLLKRCSEIHNDCQALKSYIKPYHRSHSFSTENRYSRYRDYSNNYSRNMLLVPCNDFVEYVEEMEQIFLSSFKGKRIDCKLLAFMYKQIKEIPFSPPCSCFPTKFCVILFIRMRIFYTLKTNNDEFLTSQASRKYFCIDNLY